MSPRFSHDPNEDIQIINGRKRWVFACHNLEDIIPGNTHPRDLAAKARNDLFRSVTDWCFDQFGASITEGQQRWCHTRRCVIFYDPTFATAFRIQWCG
ncbi:MAG: hypothetical protein EOP83_03520 [Verrucomicrobiaceae bacterium]|nr:MAG: hypothetical protein EOP83_03520 [Verrucomicrobiaceae bacterium]